MTDGDMTVEAYARKRMEAGDLLTWQLDLDARVVTFFIPSDTDESSYPAQLDGKKVVVRKLPRPVASISAR